MDIERVALEAIKQKIEEIFKKVQVKSSIEGREIVFRLSIPNELMQIQENPLRASGNSRPQISNSELDSEAQKAQNELLGIPNENLY